METNNVVKKTLASYLEGVTFRPFEATDFDAFAGVSTATPLIGEGGGEYVRNVPSVVIVDGDDLQIIDGDGNVIFATVTYPEVLGEVGDAPKPSAYPEYDALTLKELRACYTFGTTLGYSTIEVGEEDQKEGLREYYRRIAYISSLIESKLGKGVL